MDSSYQGGVSFEDRDNNFQRLSQTIASNIKKISQNVSSMSKMVNQLQTPQDSQEHRNQLRQIQNYNQKLARDTSSLIMELMKLPTDQPAHKMTRERLRDEYMITLNSFQSTQRLAAQKTKEDVRKVKAQSASINIGDPFAISGDSSNKELMEMGEPTLREQEQVMQTERSLVELEERERDIRQLESDIMDVNQIFKELGTMIHSQGEVVNSIESSVEYATVNVESGTQELREAANYKNKLRKKKVYLFLALIIIVSIILIIIFHK
ncbi:syntaxin-7 [Spodoptera frugiperda]|uniref:Syntaxin-7 n=1 Tax=Spodoptera frugiperda TaxID=7108 RepID=A0A9R0DGV4_SPOFR|nr:syntaxin-7 [Spodoptera frugiperda]